MNQLPFCLEDWLSEFIKRLRDCFDRELLFAGLQGSCARGEATPESDVDLVVIFRQLRMDELGKYRKLLSDLPFSDHICGFVCGEQELLAWPAFDRFHLCMDTKPMFGSLDKYCPTLDRHELEEAVLLSVSELYHDVCHSYLFGKDRTADLKRMQKAAFFILRLKHYAQKGVFLHTREKLLKELDKPEAGLLNLVSSGQEISEKTVDSAFALLLDFCSGTMRQYSTGRKLF